MPEKPAKTPRTNNGRAFLLSARSGWMELRALISQYLIWLSVLVDAILQ
jgi:hypothetical protein